MYVPDTQKILNKYNQPTIDTLQSSSFSKMFRKENKKQKASIEKQQKYMFFINERDLQIRNAIESRFQKTKFNHQYKYDNKQSSSIDSSQIQEYKHLEKMKFYNLADQNKIEKRKINQVISLEKSKSKKYKLKKDPLILKTEGDSPSEKKLNNWLSKFNEKKVLQRSNQNPMNILNKSLNKIQKNTDLKLNLSYADSNSKYQTITSHQLQKHIHKSRYNKKGKTKENSSKISSHSSSSRFRNNFNLTMRIQKSNQVTNRIKNALSSNQLRINAQMKVNKQKKKINKKIIK